MKSTFQPLNRRRFLRASAALGLPAGPQRIMPACAFENTGLKANPVGDSETNGIHLLIREEQLQFGQRRGAAITINGTVPGPLVRLREGSDAVLRVMNSLKEDSSIHWHGLILPPGMDGVPGGSFAGIKAGETFICRFPVRQNGTYWYHSHSAGQEQSGHYGPLIIDAAKPEPFQYDREHVVVLSDWTSENPMSVMAKLKRHSNYYNFQRRAVGTFFHDAVKNGFKPTVTDRLEWGRMRMAKEQKVIPQLTTCARAGRLSGLSLIVNSARAYRLTPGLRVCAAISLLVWIAASAFCSAECVMGCSDSEHMDQAPIANHQPHESGDHDDSFCISLHSICPAPASVVFARPDFGLTLAFESVLASAFGILPEPAISVLRQPPDRDWVFRPEVCLGPALRTNPPPFSSLA